MARILILQDEASWNAALRRSLEDYHELAIIDSSSAAIKALHEVTFDSVISRVHLKKQDVFHFLKELKSDPALAQIPVICFCGLRSRSAKIANRILGQAVSKFGADAYLSIEDFCNGDSCDLEGMRRIIESVINEHGKVWVSNATTEQA